MSNEQLAARMGYQDAMNSVWKRDWVVPGCEKQYLEGYERGERLRDTLRRQQEQLTINND